MRMMRLVQNRFVDSSGLYLCVHVDLSDEYSCKLKNRFLEDLSAQTSWPCYYGNRSAAKVKTNLFAPRISTVRYTTHWLLPLFSQSSLSEDFFPKPLEVLLDVISCYGCCCRHCKDFGPPYGA